MAKDLKKVVKQLKGAVIAHGKQANTIEKHIKKMEDGASFSPEVRERIQKKKDMNEQINKAQGLAPDAAGNVNDRFGINSPQNQPYSNGTGENRGVFGQYAQNAITNIRQGQNMGNILFSGQQPPVPQHQDPNMMNMGMSMGVSPKKQAKAEAKAYADKHGIRGKARKEMVKEAKKSKSFDAETNTQSKATAKAKKEVDFGGASMNGGGRKKPTSQKIKSDNTNIKKFQKPIIAKGDGGVGPIQGSIAPMANKAAAYATDAITYPFQKMLGQPTMQMTKKFSKKK
tara:strand:+ start:276 stop:1130 length:855 start_codon:yes stop_codon:yes gene_type:complete